MENNKYYVPEIEEFRVGFEYERMNGDKWEKDELGKTDCFGTHARGYENEFEEICMGIRSVRVKYLDSQDIEELGFTLKHKVVDLWFEKEGTFESPAKETYLYSKIFINYGLHDRYCKIRAKYASDNDEIELFRGTILNKSELIFIFKRIGVL